MNNEERVMTGVVRELIKSGIITSVSYAANGALVPVIGPEGGLLAFAAGSLILALSEREFTWSELCQIGTWKEIVVLVLKVVGNMALQNVDILVQIARRVANFIQSLFNRNNQQNVSNYVEQPVVRQ